MTSSSSPACGTVFSVSVGQFHYETDGFRANNDLTQDIYNVFAQAACPKHERPGRVPAIERDRDGDLHLRFDPDNFSPTFRQTIDLDSYPNGVALCAYTEL